MQRRTFLSTTIAGLAGATLASAPISASWARPNRARRLADVPSQTYPFVLPALGYANDAVEPAVDAMTMGIHHDRHHAAYVTNLNTALEPHPALHRKTLRELLSGLSTLPDAVRSAVRNNGGGHANHAMFWALLAPGGAKTPTGSMATAITRDFGSQTALFGALKAAGLGQFGSGWAWMVRDAGGRLSVIGLPNQDSPLSNGMTPLLGIDVWEHAYYLKYQNRRADYLDAILQTVNWDAVNATFMASSRG